MIKKISKILSKNNIFHKINKKYVLTRRSKVKIPEINFDISYLVGVIAGDGTLIKSKRKRGGFHYMLRIYSEYPFHLKYLNKLFKKEFNIYGNIKKDKRKNKTFYLQHQNATIFYYFKYLEAKYSKKFPKRINGKNKLHYISGLIDTDGSVSRKRIQLKLKDKEFLKELTKILEKLNTQPNPIKINYTNNIPFYYTRFDNIFPLRLKPINLLNSNPHLNLSL